MADYKQLCAELVAAWDNLPWHYDWKGNLIGLADGCRLDDSAVERARAALAETEPERFTVQVISNLPHHGENYIGEHRDGEIQLDGHFSRADLQQLADSIPTNLP